MNKKIKKDQADVCPYKDLFIYYIQGKIDSIEQADPDIFIGSWEEDDFSFLFFSKQSDNIIARILKDKPGLILLDQYQMTYEEWQGGRLEPFKAGNFIIVPPWKKSEFTQNDVQDAITILLDPGVVFGTGTHPTTCDCMDLIWQVCKQEKIQTAIDMGTGTGVLAIGAACLGCSNIFALDFNLLAVKTAKRNISLNNLDGHILAFQGKAEDFIDIPGDLLIANIHYDVMEKLICSKGLLNKKWFILSGLLRSQAREAAFKLSKMPVEIIETRDRDGIWHTFLGRVC
ncbi:Ribosomal protein methyltransferase domain-containing protein [Desulfonema limicola]|uniref:Ribosomal protein methyltransferase domain-containing protein n=1 Tax=Desulfonema limicola TaxID=45656 RepID=A0A975GFU9_9BACT|nr:50S ribosomal protein L11 methyltransferase [Desulfonema limicola]QTA79559.1 Ribosomal protein methyltransferase domain-containing protein [Desulfonema limicola]